MCTPEILVSMYEGFELRKSDVTVFSDYGKGLFDFGWYKNFLGDRISIVDPKGDAERWHGCTIFKPNSAEARVLTGKTDWKDQAWALKTMAYCRDVVITDGANGVAGIAGDQLFEYRPQHHPDVNSVIGAGDCFVAFLAMAVSHGFSTQDAAAIAYEAGAVYVQSKHNRPLKPAELLSGKCGNQVVFTNGCFDILHTGHIQTLEFAREQGDILVVGVNSDESVRRLKGEGRPVNKLADRIRVLSAMKCVDCVMPFVEDTPLNLIKYVRPDIVVKGGDYKPEDVVSDDIADVVIAPMIQGFSTTNIISKIN
jgi:D-beta-D-heptose 7-phosphate kinase / D-beta-D-heptose 1-phosphate adenosyltransferase